MHGHVADRYEYGRYGNPTIAAAEARLAALEGAEAYEPTDDDYPSPDLPHVLLTLHVLPV